MFQSAQNMSGVCRRRVEMVWDMSGVPNGLQNPSIQNGLLFTKKVIQPWDFDLNFNRATM